MNLLFRILVALSFLLLGEHGFVYATPPTSSLSCDSGKIFEDAIAAASDAGQDVNDPIGRYIPSSSEKDNDTVAMPEVEDETDEYVFIKKFTDRKDYFVAFYDHGGNATRQILQHNFPVATARCTCNTAQRYILYRVFRI